MSSDLISNLLCLSLGIIIFSFIGYTNWYGNVKNDYVQWIGKKICRPVFGDEKLLADGIFMGVTVNLLVVAVLLIVLSLP